MKKANFLLVLILIMCTSFIMNLNADTYASNPNISYRGICDCGEFLGKMACGKKPTCNQVCGGSWTGKIYKEYNEKDIDVDTPYVSGDCDNARLLPVDDSKCTNTNSYTKGTDGKCYTKCSLQIFTKEVCEKRASHKWDGTLGCCIYEKLTQQTGCSYQTTEELCKDYGGCTWKKHNCINEPSADSNDSEDSGGSTGTNPTIPGINIGNSTSCSEILGNGGQSIVKVFIVVIRIFAPILLIALSAKDFMAAIPAQDEEATMKAWKTMGTRAIITIIIMLLPTFLNLMGKLFNIFDSCDVW